jgi:hypothetical protein
MSDRTFVVLLLTVSHAHCCTAVYVEDENITRVYVSTIPGEDREVRARDAA